MDQPAPSPPSVNLATSVACLNCREKHLKCDGNVEGCGRCSALNLFCHFVPSRRGRRAPKTGEPYLDPCDIPMIEEPPLDISLPLLASDGMSPVYAPGNGGNAQGHSHLTKIFYECFHPAHPFLPPLDLWLAASPSQYLVNIVEFIGLHHVSPHPIPGSISELQSATNDAELSVEQAQAYLLLSILLHARGVPEGAKEYISLAIGCSLRLGMHCHEAADAVEMQDPVRAESMKRTWWEIFVIDTLLAAVQIRGTLQFNMETPGMPLPCDDKVYLEGHSAVSSISAPGLTRRSLFTDDNPISSLAYRIEASLILRQCLVACEEHASEETVDVLDAAISSWFHRWPSDRKAILQPSGKVNQIDLQAAMIMHCASIYLHFTKSFLLPCLPATSELFCSRPPGFSSPSTNAQWHTAKIGHAAVELSKLASSSTSVSSHTPFFACTLVLSSIVQLTIVSTNAQQAFEKYHSFLGLNIGVLKSMGNIWTVAAVSMERLRGIVREVEAALADAPRDVFGGLSIPSIPPR